MNCKVTISNAEIPVVSQGTLTFTEKGFNIRYVTDGDGCDFSYFEGTAFQTRKGEFGFDVSFREGEETACVLRSGGFSGSVPVKTLRLSVSVTARGALVELKYLLGGEARELSLSAELI